MKKFIQKFFKYFLGTLDTHTKDGLSARKVTAFTFSVMTIIIEGLWLKHACIEESWGLLLEVLAVNTSFILVLLGLTTYQNIKSNQELNKTE